uniref:Uncharacterized protein n=1 Tax=Anopheles braziliensis TaxID=58242 RepID=A0A2M3ZLQ1_9DIPT
MCMHMRVFLCMCFNEKLLTRTHSVHIIYNQVYIYPCTHAHYKSAFPNHPQCGQRQAFYAIICHSYSFQLFSDVLNWPIDDTCLYICGCGHVCMCCACMYVYVCVPPCVWFITPTLIWFLITEFKF